jgi:hypothetical protein
MPEVELLTQRVGRGYIQYPGDVVTVDDETAKRLVQSGQAIPAQPAMEQQTATPLGQERRGDGKRKGSKR